MLYSPTSSDSVTDVFYRFLLDRLAVWCSTIPNISKTPGVRKPKANKINPSLFKMACRVFSVIRTNNDIKKCFSLTRRFAGDTSKTVSQGNESSLTLPKNTEVTLMDKDEVLYRDAMKDTVTVSSVEDVGLVSGVPEEHIKTRKARIFCPPKNAMQAATDNIHFWQIDFDTRERWENPLIGWTSTGDPMSNLKVEFATEQEAIAHCEKMGWDYYIQKPNVNSPKPRTYGSNFAWNKRTRVSTK